MSSGEVPSGEDAGTSGEDPSTSRFECNICLETAKDAVISLCGHLFCWPCLHRWLETRPTQRACPVCKAAIGRDKVIPLYGKDGDRTDPRDKAPPRPAPHRTEPANGGNEGLFGGWGGGANAGGGGGGLQFTMGIGAFPFSFFSSTFNLGAANNPDGQPGQADEDVTSKIFILIAVFVILWLVLS